MSANTWLQFALIVAVVIAIYLPIGWFFMLLPNPHPNEAPSLSPA
jgi:hypothetical protein